MFPPAIIDRDLLFVCTTTGRANCASRVQPLLEIGGVFWRSALRDGRSNCIYNSVGIRHDVTHTVGPSPAIIATIALIAKRSPPDFTHSAVIICRLMVVVAYSKAPYGRRASRATELVVVAFEIEPRLDGETLALLGMAQRCMCPWKVLPPRPQFLSNRPNLYLSTLKSVSHILIKTAVAV